MSTWKASFDARNDLKQYGDSAIGLFALQLRFKIENIAAVAADSLTDGSDDKKADLVYIDPEDRVAVIAQCYRSTKTSKVAPSNKASDLNTAVAWLLGRAEAITIEPLKSQAIELQKRLAAGEIKTLFLWYVHNLPKSKNVAAIWVGGEVAVQMQYTAAPKIFHHIPLARLLQPFTASHSSHTTGNQKSGQMINIMRSSFVMR